jgi:hypothetical protein
MDVVLGFKAHKQTEQCKYQDIKIFLFSLQ